MLKYPRGGYTEHYYVEEAMEEFAYKDDYHYGGGSSVQMKPAKHFNLKPEHGYGHHNAHGHGYGHQNTHGHGYEYDNCPDNFEEGNDSYSTQYSAIRYEKEQYTEPWNHKHNHAAHGDKHYNAYQHQSNAPYGMGGGYACGGYGGHYRGHGQHNHGYGEEKSFWKHKGIMD